MRIRPLATAAAAALVLGAVAGPAVADTAATPARPAAGSATSALTLLSLALAGHDVRVGNVALNSDTVSGAPDAKVVVTPVRADGTAYGEQTVTPASSPATVPAFDSGTSLPAALGTLASLKSPVFTASSSNTSGASSRAGAASLGSVSLLGLPVKLDGTIDASSLVNGTNAVGNKTLSVKNLALPSIADILGALGLNLKALPVKTLTDLLAGLNLTDTAVTAAQQALDAATAAIQAQLNAANQQLDSANSTFAAAASDLASKTSAADAALAAVAPATAALAPATAAVNTATSALTAKLVSISAVALATLPSGANTPAGYLGLSSADKATVEALVPGTAAAAAALTAATTQLATAQSTAAAANAAAAAAAAAVTLAKSVVATAQAAVDAATALLKGLLGQVAPQLNSLIAAVTAVLNNTPLVSIDSFTVQTQALATSASAGGQSAQVVGGQLQGVHVLGTDVLNNVLGNSSVNVLDLAGSTLAQVTAKVDALTGALSSVLSAVPGLKVPAPQVQLLTKSTSTSIANGFGTASDSVNALSISLPAITIPAALALPGAASLPAISGVPSLTGALRAAAIGDVTSKAMTIGLGTLTEQASFRPAVAAVPATPSSPSSPGSVVPPQLPRTGLPAGIAVCALFLVGGGLVLRRRFAAQG